MKKSLVKYQIIIFFAFFIPLTTNAITLPNESSGNHNERCKNDHTKRGVLDKEMYEYCMEREHEAYLNFISKANQYKENNWIQSAIDFVIEKNTKRGVRDDSQVNYRLDSITEGFENIKYAMKQQNSNNSKMESCYSHWGIQLDMVYYCYEN